MRLKDEMFGHAQIWEKSILGVKAWVEMSWSGSGEKNKVV